MEYSAGFNLPTESARVNSWCVPFDILGFGLVILVLCLSVVRHKGKFNLGPRIFTANMMLIDLIHATTSFVFDLSKRDMKVYDALKKVGVFSFMLRYVDHIRSFGMLAFNCTLIPMMVMSIVACYSTQNITEKSAAIRFAGIVGISDCIPLVIQVINAVASSASGGPSWASTTYTIASFLLYFVQVTVSVCALAVFHRKSKQYSGSSNKNDGGANKNLLRLLTFATGPCLLQIPFAIFLVLQQTGDSSEFYQRMSLGVRLIFSMKPMIDALFTLLFLGEYRQYTLNVYKWLREKLAGHRSGQTTTRVTELQRRPIGTSRGIPSTVSGHLNNIQNGAHPSAIGRSASLPVQITTISV